MGRSLFRESGLAGPEEAEALLGGLAGRVPIKRLGGTDEIADEILFLASARSSCIAGAELYVDGAASQIRSDWSQDDRMMAMTNATVLTAFGGPEVLQWQAVERPAPHRGEVLIRVKAAGVGPTDLHIRAGHLVNVFPQRPGDVLGFEAAGVVEAVGEGSKAGVGDEVVALLPLQGGYSELVATSVWYPKPAGLTWAAAAALPASAEAAVGTLRQVRAAAGETLVVLGAAGSVGLIIVQVAHATGIRVIAAASDRDRALVESLGGEWVAYGEGVFDRVDEKVDAVIDAAGRGGLTEAVAATGDPSRVVTLVGGPDVASSGAMMSTPGPDRAPDALHVTVPMLAEGTLVLKARRELPIAEAATAHRLLESGQTRDKIVLIID